MKKTIAIIIFILSVIPTIYSKDINYKSSCVYYYIPFDECYDSRGYIDIEFAISKGVDIWVLMVLDDNDILFEKRGWGNFHYGIRNNQTVKYTRQQSIDDLNFWLDFYYDIAKADRKYRYDGYSTSYFYYDAETEFKACPNFYEVPDLIANGDKVDSYFGFGHSTDKVERNIFITKNHEVLVLCPAGQTPCIDESDGVANYMMFLRIDIESYLPQ